MTQLLVLACIVIALLAVLLGFQAWTHASTITDILEGQAAEQNHWAAERRFLIDRAIAQHVGEVIALDQSEQRRNHPTVHRTEREPNPLLEGLS